MEKKFVGIFES